MEIARDPHDGWDLLDRTDNHVFKHECLFAYECVDWDYWEDVATIVETTLSGEPE